MNVTTNSAINYNTNLRIEYVNISDVRHGQVWFNDQTPYSIHHLKLT